MSVHYLLSVSVWKLIFWRVVGGLSLGGGLEPTVLSHTSANSTHRQSENRLAQILFKKIRNIDFRTLDKSLGCRYIL